MITIITLLKYPDGVLMFEQLAETLHKLLNHIKHQKLNIETFPMHHHHERMGTYH